MKKYDVCAIGNALVDYEIEVNDEFFTTNRLEKGMMTLVDEEKQKALVDLVQGKITKKQAGGSAANTVFGLCQLGGSGYYTCKVANDEDGIFFLNDFKAQNIPTNLEPDNLPKGITGKCLVMITPDAERTMNTFLGITTDFSSEELDYDAIANSKYLFMEGFLVTSQTGLVAMKKAKQIAMKNNVKVSLSLSDPMTVKYFRDQMAEVVENHVDMLFCNIEEAKLFTGLQDLEEIKRFLEKVAGQYVITLGREGSLTYDGHSYFNVSPFTTDAIDSTGAGDLFAGAFLYGINQGYPFEKAGELASLAGATVVAKFGSRLDSQHILEIKKESKYEKTIL